MLTERRVEWWELSSSSGVFQCAEEASECVIEDGYGSDLSSGVIGLPIDSDGDPSGGEWCDEWLEERDIDSGFGQHGVEVESDLSGERGLTSSSELEGVADEVDAIELDARSCDLEVALCVAEGGLLLWCEAEDIKELNDDGQLIEFSGADLKLSSSHDIRRRVASTPEIHPASHDAFQFPRVFEVESGELSEFGFGHVQFDVIVGEFIDACLCIEGEQSTDGSGGDSFLERDIEVLAAGPFWCEGLAGSDDEVVVAVVKRSADLLESISPECGRVECKVSGHFGMLPVPFSSTGDPSRDVFELDSGRELIVGESSFEVPGGGDRKPGFSGPTQFDQSTDVEGALWVESDECLSEPGWQGLQQVVVGDERVAGERFESDHPVFAVVDFEDSAGGDSGLTVSSGERVESESAVVVVGESKVSRGVDIGQLVGERGQLQGPAIDGEVWDGDLDRFGVLSPKLDSSIEGS